MIEILNDFERHLIEDGKRPKTVESYVGDAKGLIEYLSEINVTFEVALGIINKKINILNSFNHYLIQKG